MSASRRFEPGVSRVTSARPLVELLIADKGAEWAEDRLAVAVARRPRRGCWPAVYASCSTKALAPGEIVVLTSATTDLRVYERALEDEGIPTYVIGGRGYWSHPQVVDFVSYLSALANPRDEQALYTVLASPLAGASPDALVLLAAAAREADKDPWWLLSSGG